MKDHLRLYAYIATGVIIFVGLLLNSFWVILLGIVVFLLGTYLVNPDLTDEIAEIRDARGKRPPGAGDTAPRKPNSPQSGQDSKKGPRSKNHKKNRNA